MVCMCMHVVGSSCDQKKKKGKVVYWFLDGLDFD